MSARGRPARLSVERAGARECGRGDGSMGDLQVGGGGAGVWSHPGCMWRTGLGGGDSEEGCSEQDRSGQSSSASTAGLHAFQPLPKPCWEWAAEPVPHV